MYLSAVIVKHDLKEKKPLSWQIKEKEKAASNVEEKKLPAGFSRANSE